MEIIEASVRSLHSTAAMFWGGAAYNNGILDFKQYILGEAYDRNGEAVVLKGPKIPDNLVDAAAVASILPQLYPLPTWESLKPGDIFRVFERGGRNIANLFPETGLPNAAGQLQRIEEPGRPDFRQSNRGPGTGARISVPVINITKTRLNDPLTWFIGTNDQPGDYRHSGCASCHVVYANDRDPRHSGVYAKFGHEGRTQTVDPTISKTESGHPLTHTLTRSVPTSQCMICHMHQPNMFLNTFLGYTMWDYESDAPRMWPEKQQYPDSEKIRDVLDRNPEGAATRGKWADVGLPEAGVRAQSADEGHAVRGLSRSRLEFPRGVQARPQGQPARRGRQRRERRRSAEVQEDRAPVVDPRRRRHAMRRLPLLAGQSRQRLHLRRSRGRGRDRLQGLPRHRASGAESLHVRSSRARRRHGHDDAAHAGRPAALRVGRRRALSALDDGSEPRMEDEPVKNAVDPASPDYNEKAARAKLMSRNTSTLEWGKDVKADNLAHTDENMECYTCHTSWTTSCAGCHLPIEANAKTERHHYEGGETRNYATYNPQVARDDMFLLGRREPAAGGKIAPVRSTSALVLSSTNSSRERIYVQQPPIAASGYSSQAFNPHYPHTERKTETKTCSDCHLSKDNDNNAIMAQLLAQGTNFVNFVGYNAYVGGDGEISGVTVTEWDEPQAVIGSYLHKYAYPDWYAQHEKNGRRLQHGYSHGAGDARCLQLRGEYLYVAEGSSGVQVYDVASIGNKGVSQRAITAPFSPLGHDTQIGSKDATCVALPTNQPIHPPRNTGDKMRKANLEQPFHAMYNYAYITDAQGRPDPHRRQHAGRRRSAQQLPEARADVESERRAERRPSHHCRRLLPVHHDQARPGDRQRRRAAEPAVDRRGAAQRRARVGAAVPLSVRDGRGRPEDDRRHRSEVAASRAEQHDPPRRCAPRLRRAHVRVRRGRQGRPGASSTSRSRKRMREYQRFTANGALNDARDVIVATTNASLFAYVADGKNGLKVLQLTSPESQPKFYGFSPDPKPQLIATYATGKPALSLSRGLERDRGVDETGNQIAVFGRRGSRPLNLQEMQKLYLDANGKPWYGERQTEMRIVAVRSLTGAVGVRRSRPSPASPTTSISASLAAPPASATASSRPRPASTSR